MTYFETENIINLKIFKSSYASALWNNINIKSNNKLEI